MWSNLYRYTYTYIIYLYLIYISLYWWIHIYINNKSLYVNDVIKKTLFWLIVVFKIGLIKLIFHNDVYSWFVPASSEVVLIALGLFNFSQTGPNFPEVVYIFPVLVINYLTTTLDDILPPSPIRDRDLIRSDIKCFILLVVSNKSYFYEIKTTFVFFFGSN